MTCGSFVRQCTRLALTRCVCEKKNICLYKAWDVVILTGECHAFDCKCTSRNRDNVRRLRGGNDSRGSLLARALQGTHARSCHASVSELCQGPQQAQELRRPRLDSHWVEGVKMSFNKNVSVVCTCVSCAVLCATVRAVDTLTLFARHLSTLALTVCLCWTARWATHSPQYAVHVT